MKNIKLGLIAIGILIVFNCAPYYQIRQVESKDEKVFVVHAVNDSFVMLCKLQGDSKLVCSEK